MKRHHLVELEDLEWFPKSLRDYGTDFLQAGANAVDMYRNIVPILKKGLEKSGGKIIIDIASGGGGGWLKLGRRLEKEVPGLKIILTDFYPNITAFKRTKEKLGAAVGFTERPVDARDVPEELKGLRTMFLSFHHFKPEDAKAILQNAIDRVQPIAIFEGQQRDVKSMILMLLSPLNLIFTTPFIRPFRLGRMLFTYLIPVMPLFVLWDGIVSVLRTYTLKELQQMVLELRNHDTFDWEIDIAKGKPVDVEYLLGTPKVKRL